MSPPVLHAKKNPGTNPCCSSVNCDGSKVDIAHPGAGDLMMFMRWATRAKAMTCDRAPAKDN